MPRQPRLDLPGIAQHITQRGNNRQPCFLNDSDRLHQLTGLRELSLAHDCRVHAYVLMSNHVHLLPTPTAAGQESLLMHCLGRRHVRHVNDRYGRSGTLWEGWHKSCLVGSDEHVLRCYRHIELNPLRAAMVADPGAWPWSSFAANAEARPDPLVSPHPAYRLLGSEARERADAYRRLVAEAIDPADIEEIRADLQRQHALGNPRLQAAIEAPLARRVTPGKPGRPPSASRTAEKVLCPRLLACPPLPLHRLQQTQGHTVLVAPQLTLLPDQLVKAEDGEVRAVQTDRLEAPAQVLVAILPADEAKDVERPRIGHEQQVPAGEDVRANRLELGAVAAIAGIELLERGHQPTRVVVADADQRVEVECRDRCTVKHGRHPADNGKLNPVAL
jgi:putative transposase